VKPKVLVLLSGGLDSAVTLALAVKNKKNPLALTVDYGQKAARQEIAASQKLADFYRVPLEVLKIDWLKNLPGLALLNKDCPVPAPDFHQLSLKVWVPNRNGLLVNIAATIAEGREIPLIYAGVNREEAGNFPDNSREFVRSVNQCFKFSTLGRVQLKSYLINWNKTQILKKALQLGVPLNFIWVCYLGGRSFCGRCESCQRFQRALKNVHLRRKK
jgi:7-cyano-7-deazaguanine synthase